MSNFIQKIYALTNEKIIFCAIFLFLSTNLIGFEFLKGLENITIQFTNNRDGFFVALTLVLFFLKRIFVGILTFPLLISALMLSIYDYRGQSIRLKDLLIGYRYFFKLNGIFVLLSLSIFLALGIFLVFINRFTFFTSHLFVLYVLLSYSMVFPLIIDKKLSSIQALTHSRQISLRNLHLLFKFYFTILIYIFTVFILYFLHKTYPSSYYLINLTLDGASGAAIVYVAVQSALAYGKVYSDLFDSETGLTVLKGIGTLKKIKSHSIQDIHLGPCGTGQDHE